MHGKHSPQQRSNTLSRGHFHRTRHRKSTGIFRSINFSHFKASVTDLWVFFAPFPLPIFGSLVFPFFPVSWHIFMWWHISIHQLWRAIREACRLLRVIHYGTELISCLSLTMSVSSERWDYMRDTSWASTCFIYSILCVHVWKETRPNVARRKSEKNHVSFNMTFNVITLCDSLHTLGWMCLLCLILNSNNPILRNLFNICISSRMDWNTTTEMGEKFFLCPVLWNMRLKQYQGQIMHGVK